VPDTRAVFDDSEILQVFEESLMPVWQPQFNIIWHYSPDDTVCQETVEPAGV
jgi:hypothetical protein